MGFTGKGFVGFIGVAPTLPTSLEIIFTSNGGLNSMTLNHGAPTGTVAGDVMMLSLTGYSNEGAQGGAGSITPDANWTNLVTLNSSRKTLRLYTKVADAADEAGTSSYSWLYTASGVYGALMVSTIPQRFGTTLTSPASDSTTGTALSVSAPGGAWTYAVMMSKGGRTNDSGNPTIAVTNAEATLIASNQADWSRGYHRHYTLPASVATVNGTKGTSSDSFAALIAVGVS